MTTILQIIKPGPLTTVQDQGRYGFQDRGVPVSGAMDQAAYRIGNLLVGNQGHEASLEITLGGFLARFLRDTWFALTAPASGARLNNRPIATWTCHRATEGDLLSLEYGKKGARWYLALAGGVEVPKVMGSRSTYLRAAFGGFHGRSLVPGDILESGPPRGPGLFFPPPLDLVPAYSPEPVLRVILGPQDDQIKAEGLSIFFKETYKVSQRSDRMGCVLEGPAIGHKTGPDIISDGTAFGSIQVPGNGQPIILMADRQTVGGYVKIATVISIDLPLIAQSLPGFKIRFQAIGLEEARELVIKKRNQMAQWIAR